MRAWGFGREAWGSRRCARQKLFSERREVVVNPAELLQRREKHNAQKPLRRGKTEARSVDAQNAGLSQQSQHEILVRVSPWQIDARHRVKRGVRRDAANALDCCQALDR